MRRRSFVTTALAAALPVLARAQSPTPPVAAPGPQAPPEIQPQNALEYAFVAALTNEAMRPVFRRQFMEAHVVLALASDAPDAPPREVAPREGVRAGLVFTGATRLDAALGPAAPRATLTGRAALERLRGRHVVINARLAPMLVLEPEDVASYLETPEAPPTLAGPSQ
jgi:hypothetical protein